MLPMRLADQGSIQRKAQNIEFGPDQHIGVDAAGGDQLPHQAHLQVGDLRLSTGDVQLPHGGREMRADLVLAARRAGDQRIECFGPGIHRVRRLGEVLSRCHGGRCPYLAGMDVMGMPPNAAPR